MENLKHLAERVKYDKLSANRMVVSIFGIDYFLVQGVRFPEENKLELLLDCAVAPSAIQQAEECAKTWHSRIEKEKTLELKFLDRRGTVISKIIYHGLQFVSWDFDSTLDKNKVENDSVRIKICFDYISREVVF
jgi:hypothetical protein